MSHIPWTNNLGPRRRLCHRLLLQPEIHHARERHIHIVNRTIQYIVWCCWAWAYIMYWISVAQCFNFHIGLQTIEWLLQWNHVKHLTTFSAMPISVTPPEYLEQPQSGNKKLNRKAHSTRMCEYAKVCCKNLRILHVAHLCRSAALEQSAESKKDTEVKLK